MKISNLLNEARRNSAHPAQQKGDIFAKYREMDPEEVEYFYISFTDVHKIGINPQSQYSTPIGVYTYPMAYVLKQKSLAHLPFAGERKNIWVVESNTKVLNLKDYDDLENDSRKAKSYLMDEIGLEEADAVALINSAIKQANSSRNIDASRMWNIARRIAKRIDDIKRRTDGSGRFAVGGTTYRNREASDTVYFNTILRKVFGYRIIRDDGLGIIHINEPVQCVFLDSKAFDIVEHLRGGKRTSEDEAAQITRIAKSPKLVQLKTYNLKYLDFKDFKGSGGEYIPIIRVTSTNDLSVDDERTVRELYKSYYPIIKQVGKSNAKKFINLMQPLKDEIEHNLRNYLFIDADGEVNNLLTDDGIAKYKRSMHLRIPYYDFAVDLFGKDALDKIIDESTQKGIESYRMRQKKYQDASGGITAA